jgi:hypothetical protein
MRNFDKLEKIDKFFERKETVKEEIDDSNSSLHT